MTDRDRDWVDKMLRDALEGGGDRDITRSRDYREFEQEYHAIKDLMLERKARNVISAAAALAIATTNIRIASNLTDTPQSEQDDETLRVLVRFLVRALTLEQLAFLPSALAAIFLRKDEPHEPHRD